jgi:hypothetical protein
VVVHLSSTPGPGAQVQQISYALSGAQTGSGTLPGSSGSVTINTEGVSTLTYFATDAFGAQEASRTLIISIDKTAPEAYTQFDPTTHDLLVFGKDAGSGVSPGPTPPASVVAAAWTRDDDSEGARDDGDKHTAELRTYNVTDIAGNTTVLVIKIQAPSHDGDHLKARLISVAYGSAGPVTFRPNFEQFDWDADHDRPDHTTALQQLHQLLRIGTGDTLLAIDADFDAHRNTTEIRVRDPHPHKPITKPGLDLLQLHTLAGRLSPSY